MPMPAGTAQACSGLQLTALTLLAVLAHCPHLAAAITLPNGEPDANCPALRLWLRADAGLRDAANRSPADADFNGSVSVWSDQSARHFDLAAPPEKTPYYVPRQPGAGNRPTVAFGGGRMLARPNDSLHEHTNSTTFLVLQIQHGRPAENVVFCAGDNGGKRDILSFELRYDADAALGCLRWSIGEVGIHDALPIAADGRFAVVILRAAGENCSVEVQDGLGDALGANREMNPTGHFAVSNQCGRGYCLGGPKFDQPQSAFDGQIAEVMVYNRVLSSGERRALVAYLRRKYELDVLDALYPAGTLLMQAEDFDGNWALNPRWDGLAPFCLGQRHVTCKAPQSQEGIKRTVRIAQPGNYSVWVRAIGMGPENGLRTTVGGRPLAVTHAKGPMALSWQLAGRIDLAPGETEIAVQGDRPGDKECDAVLISPTATTLAGVEEVCALARRLHQTPGCGQIAAVFDDGRRFEGSLVSGWRGNGTRIGGDQAALGARVGRPGVRCLWLDGSTANAAPPSDALLEFHNGDRMRGTICGYAAATTQAGGHHVPMVGVGSRVLVRPAQESARAAEKPVAVETDWLRRIVFDAAVTQSTGYPRSTGYPPRRCPPRSVVCRDGRVLAFRALRFSDEGVSLLTDEGLVRLAYRELAEVAMQPIDAWEAYHRQLAQIDPNGDAGIVRLETGQGMVFTTSTTGFTAFRDEAEAAASTCLVRPAWSSTPVPVAWSAVRTLWRAPATVVPLSQFAPQRVAAVPGTPGRGILGSSWKWQADRNVAGGELRSGGSRYLWGFGVHATNGLAFPLPDSARAFRSDLGMDAAVGNSGCVVAKVYANQASGTPLFQSQPLRGSQSVISTGDIALVRGASTVQQLVLIVEDGGAGIPGTPGYGPDADPLDIGDHADWLEPILLLDPVKLHAAVEKYRRPGK